MGADLMPQPTISDRTITANEVESWFGNSSAARLKEKQYSEIAAKLTRFKWSDEPAKVGPPNKLTEDDQDRWWDFKAVPDAAKLLYASLPAMRRHWKSLERGPETQGGDSVILDLGQALEKALPYIEWPFGKYKRTTGRKIPKDWHLPAVLIAKVIVRALVESGHTSPAISKNSVVARIVRRALIRMRYLNEIDTSAIAAHLTRWNKTYGLTPNGIQALITK